MDYNNIWQKFYDSNAKDYHMEPWTKGTKEEVDFIERELHLDKQMDILDVGCGTGRHSLELSRRGYKVTGIDISSKMLHEARTVAKNENLDAIFIQADAMQFSLHKKFDIALCLCEGAFGLLDESDDEFLRDLKILNNIANCLKDNGKILLTCSSALPFIKHCNDDDIEDGIFDILNFIETFTMDDEYLDAAKGLIFKSKSFTPPEIKLLLHMANFHTLFIGGGTANAWNKHTLSINDIEMMVLAQKDN